MDQNKPNDMPKNSSTTTEPKELDINKNFLQFMMGARWPIDFGPSEGSEEEDE